MNIQTRRFVVQGPAGAIEVLEDLPTLSDGVAPRGVAVIAHPHPLFGGTMDNKVVQTLARAFVHCGWRALRFNFRGVGATEGVYDEGRGELQDLLAVIAHGADGDAAQPLALAGFSFGAFVTSHAVQSLGAQQAPQQLVLVGTAASRFTVAPIASELHGRTLVLHGEQDGVIPAAEGRDAAARLRDLGATVTLDLYPGLGHGVDSRVAERIVKLLTPTSSR